MDAARDILTGAHRHLYAVGLGLTITGAGGASISLGPLDHPLISLDLPGMWRFSLGFVPKKPTVFLNLYNNQWNTNYHYWHPGTWSSCVRVWFGNDLAVPALEARVPSLAKAITGQAGPLPAMRTGINVSRPSVIVTAFGASPALKGTLLRIWEVAGKSGKTVVTLPSGTAESCRELNRVSLSLAQSPAGARNAMYEGFILAEASAIFRAKRRVFLYFSGRSSGEVVDLVWPRLSDHQKGRFFQGKLLFAA